MATWQSVWIGRAGDEFASAPDNRTRIGKSIKGPRNDVNGGPRNDGAVGYCYG